MNKNLRITKMILGNEINLKSESLPSENVSGHAENLVETEQTAAHEHTLYAETVWQGKYFTVTNSMLNAWIVVAIVIVFSLIIRSKIKKIPSGIQNYAETVVDGALESG